MALKLVIFGQITYILKQALHNFLDSVKTPTAQLPGYSSKPYLGYCILCYIYIYICCSVHVNGEQIHLLTVTPSLCLGGTIEKEDFYLSLPSYTSTVGSRWGQRTGNTDKTAKVRG